MGENKFYYFRKKYISDIGIVESISNGIIKILGLQNAANREMVEIFINSKLELKINSNTIIFYWKYFFINIYESLNFKCL